MKKAIFAAVVLFSMTTFAVNPKSINPVKEKLEIEKLLPLTILETKQIKAAWYAIKCANGNSARVCDSYSGACAQATSFCGGGWTMYGDN